MRFEMVNKMASKILDIKLCCKTLGLSCSGYYAWKRRPTSKRKLENQRLAKEIEKYHKQSRETYGSPRIHEKLKLQGETCGKKRVERLMKAQGLLAIAKRNYKVKTTDSKHNLPVAERIFKTENAFEQVTRPNQVWASDITYIATEEGWLFLAIFLDIFTRKVVGFSMADHMKTQLVLSALLMALGRQNLIKGNQIIGHSDQGSQYASEVFSNSLQANGITASMSRKGNCYDNAFAESFFHTLKVELIYRRKFKTREEAMTAIFEYIEVWYNRQRIHSSLGYKTPVEYELTAQFA